jgi:hypothetical protein
MKHAGQVLLSVWPHCVVLDQAGGELCVHSDNEVWYASI